jgi:hypothetical protein
LVPELVGRFVLNGTRSCLLLPIVQAKMGWPVGVVALKVAGILVSSGCAAM